MAKTYPTFTKKIDGETYVRAAGSEADVVGFRFDGWTEMPEVPAETTQSAPEPVNTSKSK